MGIPLGLSTIDHIWSLTSASNWFKHHEHWPGSSGTCQQNRGCHENNDDSGRLAGRTNATARSGGRRAGLLAEKVLPRRIVSQLATATGSRVRHLTGIEPQAEKDLVAGVAVRTVIERHGAGLEPGSGDQFQPDRSGNSPPATARWIAATYASPGTSFSRKCTAPRTTARAT